MYEQAEYFGELVSEPVSGLEGRSIERKNKARKASITKNNSEEYIPQFSIVDQIKRRINDMVFKSYRASVVSGGKLQEYKSAYIDIIDDNVMADEEAYTQYLLENEAQIMTMIGNIEAYYEECINVEKNIFTPYSNRILKKMYSLHMLPFLYTNDQIVRIWNHTECESHRDKLNYAFPKILRN